jgi:hypothetical protein
MAHIIRYALLSLRRTSSETFSGMGTFGFMQSEIEVIESLYFEITNQFLHYEYEKQALTYWLSGERFMPSALSFSTDESIKQNRFEMIWPVLEASKLC